jgi:hypothetical protein
MFKVTEIEKLVSAIFPKLLSAVMLRMGACIDVIIKKEAIGKKEDPTQPTYLSPLT